MYDRVPLNSPRIVLLVAERSYRNALTFLCHQRYIFLAKISLNFSFTKLKYLMATKYCFVPPRVCVHGSQPTGSPDALCSLKSLEDWRGQGDHGVLQILVHGIESSCCLRGGLEGLNEGCLACMDFCIVFLVFCECFGNLMQNGTQSFRKDLSRKTQAQERLVYMTSHPVLLQTVCIS